MKYYTPFILSLSLLISPVFAKDEPIRIEPSNPWTESEMRSHVEQLKERIQEVEAILAAPKLKTNDVADLLRNDPYMTIHFGKSGYTPFELKSPTHFVDGESLSFKLALREQETISGPKRKEFNEPLIEYLRILEETIKYYSDKLRVLERNELIEQRYPEGLTVYEKPHSSNVALKNVYNELWRDIDAAPGGTAGILTIEVRERKELKHLKKAKDRVIQLTALRKSQRLSSADRKMLEQVLKDLRTAISEAESYYPDSSDEL
jgi:hypothetical protein